jgi:quercetin dioxygenase-like cupin family protein
MFVVRGTRSSEMPDGKVEILQPGDTFFIPRGVEYRLTAKELRRVSVLFDRDTSDTAQTASTQQ